MQDRVIRRISVHARETGEPVTVLALNCHEREGDLSTADAAMQMFEDAGVPAVRAAYTELGVRATVKTIASAARVVTGRLHGGIVSFVTGTPFVLLSDHEKMDDFLDDVAMPESHRGGLDDSGADAVGELFRNPKVPANDEYLARARSAYLGQP
jgi:polysaccharide pyruvyl transferase WcaK-like protein